MTQNLPKPKVTLKLGSSLTTLGILLLVLGLLFVVILVTSILVVLVGRILSLIFGLDLFQSSLIALGVAIGLALVFVLSSRPEHTLRPASDWDEDWDEELEEEEDDEIFPPAPTSRFDPPPGRNDLCPCGSGRKYKNCHGKIKA